MVYGMYVGLDVSKEEMVCVGMDKDGATVYDRKFGMSEEQMDRLLDETGKDSSFAVEASTKGIFVYDYLTSKNVSVKVANPNRLRLIAESEVKTDRNDAETLADFLRLNRLPVCNVPDPKTREIRDLVVHRRSVVRMQTMIRNKIRAILSREGIDVPYNDVLSKVALDFIEEAKPRLKSAVQRDSLDRFVRLAVDMESEIQRYEDKVVSRYKNSKEAQLLDTIPGIGPYSAAHIMSQICDIKNFTDDGHLASYAGLAPKTWQSGKISKSKGVKRKVNKSLKWILLNDAQAAVRVKGKLRKYYLKMKKRYGDTKRGRKRAKVAVARKMVDIMYCMLTRGEPYKE